MKLFEKYGRSIAEYEGTAAITAVDTRDQTKRIFTGYFEAQQLVDGSLRMGFISTNRPPQPVMHFDWKPRDYEITEIQSQDTSGWGLTVEDPSSLPMTWLLFAHDGPDPKPNIVEFGPRKLKVRSPYSDPAGYKSARFLVTNLLIGGGITPGAPFKLFESDDFEVSMNQVQGYESVSGRVRSGGTIEPTVELHISDIDERARPLTDFLVYMNDLVYLYRLTTGVSVDWCLAEGLLPGSEEGVERIHQAGTTGPRSVNFDRLIPLPDLGAITRAFHKKNNYVFEDSTIREFIDFFVAACDGRTALELRGLLASTLIDSILSKYAHRKKHEYIVLEQGSRRRIERAVRSAIRELSETDADADQKVQIQEKIVELSRRSFRRKLQLLSGELDLGLTDCQVTEIKNVRNSLVHKGTFPSPIQDRKWWNEYQLLIWTAFNTLCRLIGHKGRLSPRIVNRQESP